MTKPVELHRPGRAGLPAAGAQESRAPAAADSAPGRHSLSAAAAQSPLQLDSPPQIFYGNGNTVPRYRTCPCSRSLPRCPLLPAENRPSEVAQGRQAPDHYAPAHRRLPGWPLNCSHVATPWGVVAAPTGPRRCSLSARKRQPRSAHIVTFSQLDDSSPNPGK
jgi:hypothetical protein